jgi:tripartite-type tricarboxylate transporter receptor subunit TctC
MKSLSCLVASLALALASSMASAQSGSYPNRTVKIVVPYSPGSGSDVVARALGKALSDKTGQAVVVENRDGGGSLVGTMLAAKAPADGYTILIAANPFVIVAGQYKTPPYDPLKDFVPVAKVAVVPLVLAATLNAPFKTIKELVTYAKANPGKLSYASSGPGTISQQEMERFKHAAGLDIVEVGYKSTAQAMTDVLGEQIALFPAVVPLVLPHIQSKSVRALGLFDTQKSPVLPDVPLIGEELGVNGYRPMPVWYGFMAPAGTPNEAISFLNRVFQDAMQLGEVKQRLGAVGAEPNTPTNEQFSADLRAEYEQATEMAKMLGLSR